MTIHDQLQASLGTDFSVRGTDKLHITVTDPETATIGTFDPQSGEVSGYAQVKFYGFEHTALDELRERGRETVEANRPTIAERGFEVDFGSETVDPLGLSELTQREDGPDYLYLVDITQTVDSVEQGAKVLAKLAEDRFNFEVRDAG